MFFDLPQIFLFATLLAAAAALPAKLDSDSVEVLSQRSEANPDDGSFDFGFELDNGVSVSADGDRDDSGEAVDHQGGFRFISPEGDSYELTYVANEGGFQAAGDHLPVAPAFPHPIPEFVLEQIRKAAEEDAQSDEE